MFRFIVALLCFFIMNNCFGNTSPLPIVQKKLLVTGCARSGTRYIATVLKKCGMDIGHETLGNDGIASWGMVVESEKFPWGLGRNGLEFEHIFHQVRDPLKSISSIYTTEGPKSWGFITSQVPEISLNDPYIVRAAKYWYYWNSMAEKLAEWTYRVEDIDTVWDEYERRLGMQLDRSIVKEVTPDVNSRNGKPTRCDYISTGEPTSFSWDDLKQQLDPELYENIRSLAKKYGYL